jgi:hypothetical protein
MAGTNNPQRRRAAWAVLSPLLDEDALIDALWVQHDSMRGESVSDIIAYVDAISAQHMLDEATRKRLYSAYFDALRQAEDTLPMDPWPLMLQVRPSAAGPASGLGELPRAMPGDYSNPNGPTYAQPIAAPVSAPAAYMPPQAPANVPPVVQAVPSAAKGSQPLPCRRPRPRHPPLRANPRRQHQPARQRKRFLAPGSRPSSVACGNSTRKPWETSWQTAARVSHTCACRPVCVRRRRMP